MLKAIDQPLVTRAHALGALPPPRRATHTQNAHNLSCVPFFFFPVVRAPTQTTTQTMFSLLSATVGLAHATLGLAASQAALTVLSVSGAVLGQPAGDARPAVLSSKTNKCTAIVPCVGAAAPALLMAGAVDVEEEKEVTKEEEHLDVIEINAAAATAVDVADAEDEEDIAALLAAFAGEEEEAEDAFAAADAYDAAVMAGEDAVFAAAIGAGASHRLASEAVAFYLRTVNQGTPVQDAVAQATARAVGAVAAQYKGAEAVCAAYLQGDAEAHALLTIGAQAAIVVGAAALAITVVGAVAVGGLAVLASRALPSAPSALPALPAASDVGAVAATTPFLASLGLPAVSREDVAFFADFAGKAAAGLVSGTVDAVDWIRNGPRPATAEEAAEQAAWCGVSAHANGSRRLVY